MADYLSLLMNHASHKASKHAQRNSASLVGKIVQRNSGGGYDVKLTDGHILVNCPSAQRTKWAVGQYVTVENVGAFYSITGSGNYIVGNGT